MRLAARATSLLLKFATSYAGLVLLPLVVIVVSMNALSSAQTDWVLRGLLRFTQASFAAQGLADYKPSQEVRSVVVRFENGVAESLREAVTSIGNVIPAVSSRLAEEARRDDLARAAIVADGGFGLSVDTARAVAAPPLTSSALRAGGATPTVPAGTGTAATPGTGAVVISFGGPSATPQRTATVTLGVNPAVVATVTPTRPAGQAPAAASATPTTVRTATPTSTGGGQSSSNATQPAATATTAPGQTPAATAIPPTSTPPPAPTSTPAVAAPSPTTLAPTATAAAPSATPQPAATATPQAPTATPVPPTAVPPTRTPEDVQPTGVPATATPVPTSTPLPTATPPDVAMDLSVPGGSTVSVQPIFSGAVEFRAGDVQTRTVNIQNNGSRTFRYYMGVTGGSGPLWTDAANGLQMTVTRNGVQVYSGPLSMPDQLMGQLSRGGQDTLVINVFLPSTADNSYQGLTVSVSYNFTAVTI